MRNQAQVKFEEIELPEGMEIDIEEGWRKIISRQFPGDPFRAFGELIQNLIDSYPAHVPFEERKGEIITTKNSISIIDYGEGMSMERVRLLLTLGGTDKHGDPSKIGCFGIGFFSIFNEKIGATQINVTTRCEEEFIEILFNIKEPGKIPIINTRVLDQELGFSTRIEVIFDNNTSSDRCLSYAEKSLKYYPCRILINGVPFQSVWEEAEFSRKKIFKNDSCHGYLLPNFAFPDIQILCKYEAITSGSIPWFLTGGRNMFNDLRDYAQKDFPFVPGLGAVINCNSLLLTISRDSYYLNSAYDEMVAVLRQYFMEHLEMLLTSKCSKEIILKNQYALRNHIKAYINSGAKAFAGKLNNTEIEVIEKLANIKIYRLTGYNDVYSLADIKRMHTQEYPLFISPHELNTKWLGGVFKHDFVVLPPENHKIMGAPAFYNTIFNTVFSDTVNLDTIQEDNTKINELIKRGIVKENILTPKVAFIEEGELSNNELKLLGEVCQIFNDEHVKKVINNNLHLKIKEINTVYFDIVEEGIKIVTGLFNKDGNPLGRPPEINPHFLGLDKNNASDVLTIGLCRRNPLIQELIETTDIYRAYYTCTILAGELALSQKLLVPYSPFFTLIKEKVVHDIRKALISKLSSE